MDRLRDRVCLITGSTGIAAASARRLARRGRARCSSCRAPRTTPAGWPDRARPTGGAAAWAAADLDGRDRRRRGGRRGRRAVRADRRAVRGRRRERPTVRRRPDPRADRGRLGPDAGDQPAQPGPDLPGGGPPDARPGAERLGDPRLGPADGQRDRHRSRRPSSSRPTPTPRPRARRSRLMTTMAAAYATDGIRVNCVAPSLTATPMAHAGRRRRRDPRLRAPEAAARRRADGSRRGGPCRGLLPVGRVAGRDRPAAQDRRRLVGPVGLAREPEAE